MSVWMKLVVAPKLPFTLTHDQFSALIGDLLAADLLLMPCALASGPHAAGSILTDIVYADKRDEGITLHYKGEDGRSLLRTLKEVPYGQANVCAWFAGYNWHNELLRESFEQRGYTNAYEVSVVALAEPSRDVSYDLICGNIGEEYEVKYYFSSYGNHAPWDIVGTPLAPLLEHHFGNDLRIECSYS